MNNGGIVYVAYDRIRLSEDLLRPLSIFEGSQLTGVYYPPSKREGHKSISQHADFMLTPIPFRAWPVAAGLRIEIKHEHGALARIADFLCKQGINIALSQCTRSDHCYATWNLVIELENIRRPQPPTLDQLEDLAKEMPARVDKLRKDIEKQCRDALMDNTRDPYLRAPVGAWAVKSLAYFYRYCLQQKRLPFKATCVSRDTIEIQKASTIPEWKNLKPELPTLGFASLDTEHFNIRLAVLEQSILPRFRSVSIGFSLNRSGENFVSSRGVLSSIAAKLSDDWNLWRVFGEDHKDDSYGEKRKIQLFIEYNREKPLPPANIMDEEISRLKSIEKDLPHLSISPEVYPIAPRRIFVSIRNEQAFPRRDEVLKICRKLSRRFGILPQDFITVESYTATSVTEEVSRTIKSCSGMLQFFMGSAQEPSMDWLNAEFFLACYLKIPCIRFVSPPLEDRIIFQRDRGGKRLEENAPREALKNAIRSALHELDLKMHDRH